MRSNSKEILPSKLARKISPWLVNSAEMAGPMGKAGLVVLLSLFLFGPIGFGPSDHDGFVYLLGPWVFPTLGALLLSTLLTRLHLRVYRGSPFGNHTYVEDDAEVMRLTELLNSGQARDHMWQEALKLSVILFAIGLIATLYFRNSLNWTLPSSQNQFLLNTTGGDPGSSFWMSLLGCPFFTIFLLGSDYQRWCLMTWAKREASSG